MLPEQLLADLRARLQAAGTQEVRSSIQRFFKEPVESYGVLTPGVRRIAAEVYREVKGWPAAQRNRFSTELWKSGKIEESSIAVEIARRFSRQCGACEFRLFEKWLDRFASNWADCDAISMNLLARAIANEPELVRLLPAWTESRNRWKRRASAVALVREARKGAHTDAILDIAERLIGDSDEMVQKGAGWLLKEAYAKRPREVVRFLEAHRDAPRLLLRYAAEKMTAVDRERVLGGNAGRGPAPRGRGPAPRGRGWRASPRRGQSPHEALPHPRG